MKSTLVYIVSALAATVAAQSRQEYFPKCSLECLEDAIKKATNCSLDDAVCMCVQKNYEAIYNQGVNCVLQACGPDDAVGKVLPAGVKFCAAATAQAKAGTAKSTASPTGSGSASATGNASATTTPASATSSAPSSTSTGGAAATAGPAPIVALLAAGVMAAL